MSAHCSSWAQICAANAFAPATPAGPVPGPPASAVASDPGDVGPASMAWLASALPWLPSVSSDVAPPELLCPLSPPALVPLDAALHAESANSGGNSQARIRLTCCRTQAVDYGMPASNSIGNGKPVGSVGGVGSPVGSVGAVGSPVGSVGAVGSAVGSGNVGNPASQNGRFGNPVGTGGKKRPASKLGSVG